MKPAKTVTTETNYYYFDDLPEATKEKAIENLRDINTNYNWWDVEFECLRPITDGLGLTLDEITFDLGRGSYVKTKGRFDGVNEDELVLFPDVLEITDRLKALGNFGCEFKTDTRGAVEASAFDYNKPDVTKNELEFELVVKEINAWILTVLNEAYDYRVSDEAIVDTIEANEYLFTENGELER